MRHKWTKGTKKVHFETLGKFIFINGMAVKSFHVENLQNVTIVVVVVMCLNNS